MRFIIGMIAGALLTGLSAYAYDHMGRTDAAPSAASRPMVNWDVVDRNWQDLRANLTGATERLRDEWNKRSG